MADSVGQSEPATIGPSDPIDVSRETSARLTIIEAQLKKWQPRINLVAPSTMGAIRSRHIEDSLQLVPLAPRARSWLDLGSGGGFPGLVVAAALAESPGFHLVLVESNAKKCAFLRETARLAALPVDVVNDRIERVMSGFAGRFDVVSARALASLDELLCLAEPVLAGGALGLFPKGQDVDGEIAAASVTWNLGLDLIHSRTEPGAAVVVVRSAQRKPRPETSPA